MINKTITKVVYSPSSSQNSKNTYFSETKLGIIPWKNEQFSILHFPETISQSKEKKKKCDWQLKEKERLRDMSQNYPLPKFSNSKTSNVQLVSLPPQFREFQWSPEAHEPTVLSNSLKIQRFPLTAHLHYWLTA